MKSFLNLPVLIGDRIVRQINANGDERIDHDEFVKFFLKLLMGTLRQKMVIAFRCYDFGDNEIIEADDVKIILKNVPMVGENKSSAKTLDDKQIDLFCHCLFKLEFKEGLYFEDFCTIA